MIKVVCDAFNVIITPVIESYVQSYVQFTILIKLQTMVVQPPSVISTLRVIITDRVKFLTLSVIKK